MRVITGTARGMRIGTPKSGLRPTMDRVREAVFSSLGDRVPGSRVLDLFCGSGSYGLEALSRGAKNAVFVDSDTDAVSITRRNLERAGLEGIVFARDAFQYLGMRAEEDSFDLIFADPPYTQARSDTKRDFAAELLACPRLAAALEDSGTLVLECATVPTTTGGFEVLRERRYGKSRILYLRKALP